MLEILYMWIIWFILKVPELDIKESIDAELFETEPVINKQLKYSVTNALINNYYSNDYPQLKIILLDKYEIINDQLIMHYNSEYIRLQQIDGMNFHQCQFNNNFSDPIQSILNLSIINFEQCQFEFAQFEFYITLDILLEDFEQLQKCNEKQILFQHNHLTYGHFIIAHCRIEQINKIYILYYNFNSNELLLLYDYDVNYKELQSPIIKFVDYSLHQFVIIINSQFMYFKQGQILFYKIEQIDTLQFSSNGQYLFVLRRGILYQVKFQNPKLQLIEIQEQQEKLKNTKIVTFKSWKNGVLILTEIGTIRYLIIDSETQNHKIMFYDGLGIVLIMIALLSIKINYF